MVRFYTDDAAMACVGVQRCKFLLRSWREITTDGGVLVADPIKRSLGAWIKWLGALLIASLGVVAIPRAKLVRAAAAISDLLANGISFGLYRSLCGLLEHLRAVNLQGKNVMHGLYQPHGPEGASRQGPAGLVVCDDLMQKQMQRWQGLLLISGGVSVKRALLRDEMDPPPRLFVIASLDACFSDEDDAGVGGVRRDARAIGTVAPPQNTCYVPPCTLRATGT